MNFKFSDLFLALVCAFFGSLKGALVSQIKTLGPIEIFGLRSLGSTCFILPLVIYFHYTLWFDKKCNIVLLLRSLIGNIAVCGYYFGFVYLPIAEASLLFYSTPVFTIIIGHVFLEEKCGITEVISTLMSILGVTLVCVPQFSKDYSIDMIAGVAGSLIGALAQAIALAVVRKITHIPAVVVSFWWAVFGIIFSSALSGIFNRMVLWQCGWEAACIILIALIGFVSELCLVSALKSTDAVIVSIALTSEIIWAFLMQNYVNKEIPSLMSILGGVAITISLSLPPLVKLTRLKSESANLEINPERR